MYLIFEHLIFIQKLKTLVMNKKILLASLILFLFNNLYSSSELNGYWYNPRIRESIRIIADGEFLLVKGLFREDVTSVFKCKGRNKYHDRIGNKIYIEDRYTIKLKRNRGGDYIRFEKVDDLYGRSNWRKYHDYNDDCSRDRYYYDKDEYRYENRKYDDRYENKRYEDDRYDNDKYDNDRYVYEMNDTRKKDKSHGNSKRLELEPNDNSNSENLSVSNIIGTWKTKDNRYTTVAIIDTRDGIKAKFSGSTKWVDYKVSKMRPNEYIDSKGNRYVFNSSGKSTWYPADSKLKSIELEKIDSEVRY